MKQFFEACLLVSGVVCIAAGLGLAVLHSQEPWLRMRQARLRKPGTFSRTPREPASWLDWMETYGFMVAYSLLVVGAIELLAWCVRSFS